MKKSLFLFSLSFSLSIYAQKTTIYTHEDVDFKNGYELFQKQKYSTAQKSFQQIIKKQTNPQSLVRIDAEYYSAICAIELFNRDGEALLKTFIEQNPESQKVKQAYFYLGKYNYRKKKYDDAVKWFEVVDLYDLSKDEVYEFYFKRGYSYFILLQYDKAKKDFFEIKDIDTKYTSPARYYYSHISYLEKNYETALQGFQKLSNDENFGSIVPFYIAQIYYLQEKYDAVVAYAPALLDSSNNTKRAPEIAKILGESYYRTSKFKEAIPYLKRYEKSIGTLSRTDNYQLGYCFYKSNDIDNAIIYLQSAVGDKDEISQNAYYHLADCYLKKNNKKAARNSFGIASSMDFSSAIKEDALFNYAKLSYELSYNPFSEAIEAFEKYIKLYPQSDRVDDAYGFLVNVYQTTKNYSKALQSIESIKNITDEVKPTYQKIAYFRAVELFNNIQFDLAIAHFDKALKYKLDKNINALSYYWKAEAQYRLKLFKEAIDNFQSFQAMPGAFSMKEYDNSNYGIGYSYFQLKEYSSANIAFRKYLTSKDKSDNRKLNDAYIRTGDCYFMNRDYTNASENYAEAIKIKAFDTDYALYQKSLAMGLLKKNDIKISDLQSLLTNYPNSNYAASAHYELAKTYFQLNQYDNSMVYYKKIMDNYPNSSYINKSITQIGLIYYNKKEDDNALIYFDKIVRRDKNSEEARQALTFIKQIYQAKGNIQAMEDYFKEIGAAIPMASLDSAAYDIALNDYQKQDCINAIKNFNQYTQKFADGIFITESNYYRAECLYKNGDEQQALISYNYVISKNKNRFTEPSLVRISSIYYKSKNYNDALIAFTKLEENAEIPKNILDSRVGQMRCNVNLLNYDASAVAANKVISTDKVSNELLNEAHMVIAKAALAQERYDDAMSEFKALVNNANNEMGAEAKYNVAYIYYVKADYKQSQKNIFDLINQEQSYPHWMIKSLILLSDNYVAENDLFQAKTTLKTVIENSDEAELTKIAQDKLDRITEQEKQQMQKQAPEELKVNFNGTENKELFTEPENKNTNEEKKDEQPK